MVETARLRLQSPTRRDHLIIAATASDPEAQRWLGWTPRNIVAEEDRERYLTLPPGTDGTTWPAGWLHLIAIDKESGWAAGAAVVQLAEPVEIGGHLAPRFRGRGLGTELFAAVTEYAHQHLGFGVVKAGAEPENLSSRRALGAAGFTRTSGPDTHTLPDGRMIPTVWFRHESAEPGLCAAGKSTLRRARQAAPVQTPVLSGPP